MKKSRLSDVLSLFLALGAGWAACGLLVVGVRSVVTGLLAVISGALFVTFGVTRISRSRHNDDAS